MSTPEISVQLYSIHEALDADLDGSLGRLADIFPGVPRIAVTATADARTREDIKAQLRIEDSRARLRQVLRRYLDVVPVAIDIHIPHGAAARQIRLRQRSNGCWSRRASASE